MLPSTKRKSFPRSFYVSKDFSGNQKETEESTIQWIRRERPDVVICHDVNMVRTVRSAGFRVPEEIGVVHLATDDDATDWAGVNSHRREIGAAAASRVIALLQNRQFGVPVNAENTGLRGTWHYGATLLAPKPKSLIAPKGVVRKPVKIIL